MRKKKSLCVVLALLLALGNVPEAASAKEWETQQTEREEVPVNSRESEGYIEKELAGLGLDLAENSGEETEAVSETERTDTTETEVEANQPESEKSPETVKESESEKASGDREEEKGQTETASQSESGKTTETMKESE